MLTQAPATAFQYLPPTPGQRSDDLSGHRHRQVIGYLGLALPVLLVQMVRLRPNALSDKWSGGSVSAYYWTGAVSLFVGLLAALSLFLLTYRGYANDPLVTKDQSKPKGSPNRQDRTLAIIAGVSAGLVAIFPTSPPSGIAPPWWGHWISIVHTGAAAILFSTFALFSLWLFRKTAEGEEPSDDKIRRNRIYTLCGIAIVLSMIWAFAVGLSGGSIYWPESTALIFFAWSWLVKGRALHSIKSTLGTAKDKITK